MHVPTGLSMYPATQVHVYLPTRSEQVPPFRHGVDAQSFASLLQMAPEYPYAQTHEYVSGSIATVVESLQVAPFLHGDDVHSLMSFPQLKPE